MVYPPTQDTTYNYALAAVPCIDDDPRSGYPGCSVDDNPQPNAKALLEAATVVH